MEPVCLLSVLRTLIDRVVFATCISGEDVSGVAQDLEGLPALLSSGSRGPQSLAAEPITVSPS